MRRLASRYVLCTDPRLDETVWLEGTYFYHASGIDYIVFVSVT